MYYKKCEAYSGNVVDQTKPTAPFSQMDDWNYDKILTGISIHCLGHLGSIQARALALIE